MATYARGLTSQAVNLTHTTHWSECLMYYVANACSNRNLCNWRVKYEDVYLRAYETPTELRAGLARYFGFYNTRRRHSALDRRTPDAVYFDQAHRDLAA